MRKEAESVPSELHSSIEKVQEENEIETRNVKENVVIEEDKSSAEHLQGLFLYCSLFPEDFEFRKHELVQLWIAEGLDMKESEQETMEDAGIKHFNTLVSQGYFMCSRCDFKVGFDSVFSVPMYSPGNFFYKVNPVKLSVLETKSSDYFMAVNSKLDGASESTTQHLSFAYDDIDDMTFGAIPKFKNLRTLLLLSNRVSSIKRIPADLFLSLNFLTTLKLSRTLISGLPGSVGNVKPLRYLDVSYTPIRWLPESIGGLNILQTLKLRGCIHLSDLPRSMHRLTTLRHLDFDIIGQLDFMPAHLRNLTDLQTLSAFLVDQEDGRRIGELKNLNDLGGALRILRLENVLSKADAEEADLPSKKCLQRLDLHWTSLVVENIKLQEEILGSLRPHAGLRELQILFYNGTKLPAWLSSPSFSGLVVMTLFNCENCDLLPSIGQLPELKFLSIVQMNKVKEINQTFFRSTDDLIDKPVNAFPKLEILEFDIMLSLKEWKNVKEGDLPSLIKLSMESCPELVTLPSFSSLKCLKYMEVRQCQKLMSLDRNELPTSLESLIIRDCPELKEWSDKEGDQ
ncbi:hypothetical protein ABKV19_000734 [Rosa sericea]